MSSTGALAVGIDLGTTNSCVAVFRNGQVEIIQNEENSYVTPSWVTFTENGIITGHEAKVDAFKNTQNTIFEVKRLIGQPYNDARVQEDIKRLPYEIFDDQGYPKIKVAYQNKEEEYFPQEIGAFILKHLKLLAETHLSKSVTNVVVAVPAYFNDFQRQATKDAATIAGFKKVNVISEPTAAALAFSYHNVKHYKRNVLVYDFGGGTFDVSIVNVGRGKCTVKATKGDSHLGGTDITANLVNFVKEDFKERYGEEIADNETVTRRIKNRCEKVKEQLSGTVVVDLELYNLSGKDYTVSITRKQFEDLNLDVFQRTLEIVNQCLENSGLPKEEIDELVLVGGCSRIPKVHEMLKEYFDEDKINKGVNPDEAVAYGAAIHAINLLGNKYEIEDVLSLSLGLVVLEIGGSGLYLSDKIIPSNTPIPTKVTRRYPTLVDDQDSVSIIVHQGEARLAADNFDLGSFILLDITKAPAGCVQIDVCFEVNYEGILKVTASEVGTGNKKDVEIDARKKGLTLEQITNRTAEMERHIHEEAMRKEFHAEKHKAETLCGQIAEKAEHIKEKSERAAILDKCEVISLWLQNVTISSKQRLDETTMRLEEMLNTVAD